MRTAWLLGLPLILSACYYGPGPRGFWGPREERVLGFFAELLVLLLLLALLVAVGLWLARWVRREFPQFSRPGSSSQGLVPRLKALRQAGSTLPAERRERLEALILEAWEALEQGDLKRAEERLLRAEAYLELAREG